MKYILFYLYFSLRVRLNSKYHYLLSGSAKTDKCHSDNQSLGQPKSLSVGHFDCPGQLMIESA